MVYLFCPHIHGHYCHGLACVCDYASISEGILRYTCVRRHQLVVWADLAFAVLFTVEALIKVIADGFLWTPNAYFRSSWGAIDFVVLVTFWINVIAAFYNDGSVSRAIGAFKALRALRLLNVSDSARTRFIPSSSLEAGKSSLSVANSHSWPCLDANTAYRLLSYRYPC